MLTMLTVSFFLLKYLFWFEENRTEPKMGNLSVFQVHLFKLLPVMFTWLKFKPLDACRCSLWAEKNTQMQS